MTCERKMNAAEVTQNSILRISDDKTLQLLELYENEECLWNTHLEDYRHREKRTKAAERIAKTLNIRYFEAKHVMIKFKNLRNSYCQELKKIAHSINSGDDVEGYKPKVFWFSKMDSFLRPHLQPARGSAHSNTQHEEVKKEPECEEIEEWVPIPYSEDTDLPDTSQYLEQSCSENDEVLLECRPAKRKSWAAPRSPSKRAKFEGEIEQKVTSQALRDISCQMHVLMSKNDDYFENFGRYIASLLRVLPPQKALNLQPKIVSLITSSIDVGNEGRVSQSDCGSATE